MNGSVGTLFGVSVGPGDPDLITVKANKVLKRCRVLAVPMSPKGHSLALDIVSKMMDMSGKELLTLSFPMTTDQAKLSRNYKAQAACVAQVLAGGEDVAFICLGDVSVYSTFAYIGEILMEEYPVVMIPGVTSFCATACALGVSLTAADQPLHIIPANYVNIENALRLPGAKVLMKLARQFSEVRRTVLASGQATCAVVDCGTDSERLFHDLAEMPENPGYFTTIIVKDQP